VNYAATSSAGCAARLRSFKKPAEHAQLCPLSFAAHEHSGEGLPLKNNTAEIASRGFRRAGQRKIQLGMPTGCPAGGAFGAAISCGAVVFLRPSTRRCAGQELRKLRSQI